MRRINYKSDIPPLLLSLKVDENQITVPDCDFIVRFYIEGYEGRHYDCSHIGGVWSNCEPSEDGTKLVCYINNQRLGIGELCAEFHYISPDKRYSDGSQKSVVIIGSTELGVELVEDNGDSVTEAAIDVTLPFIYRTAYEIARDHGYTGTAEDFYSALASVVGIADAEKKRVTAEITRNANEQERIENEENRLNAESGRVNAEVQRVRNEAIRGDAESDRVEQEEDRKAKFKEITEFIATVRANEGNRESNEQERQTNEDTRITEEAKRVEAEKKRAAEFEQQKLDLAGKIDRSGDEMGGDLIFTDNAGVSFRTSDGGAHTMFNDTDDVAKFTADNGDTFEFKQDETPNKNSSALVVSKNLYNALDMTLDSMGSALDGDAAYRAEAGDKIFNPDTCKIQRYNSTIGGFEDLCDPIEGKLYANKMTGYIYRWDTKTKKMVFVGGVKAYTKDDADSRFAKLDDATQTVNVKELNANNSVSAKSMWIGDEGLLLGGDGNGHLTVEQDEVITDVTLNEKLATKADKTDLETKVNKTDIVQSTGTSTTAVMSQKAVSDKLSELEDDTEVVVENNITPNVIEGLAVKKSNLVKADATKKTFYIQGKEGQSITIYFEDITDTTSFYFGFADGIPVAELPITGYKTSNPSETLRKLVFPRDCYLLVSCSKTNSCYYIEKKTEGIGFDVYNLKHTINESKENAEFSVEGKGIWYEDDSSRKGGSDIIASSNKATSFIKLGNAKSIVFKLTQFERSTFAAVAYYDKDKNYLGGLKGYDGNTEVTISALEFPSGAFYVRFSSVWVEGQYAIVYYEGNAIDGLKKDIKDINTALANYDNEFKYWAACGDSITHANHKCMTTLAGDDPYNPIDDYQGRGYDAYISGNYPNYAYLYCKKHHIKWANYGFGGTIIGSYVPIGETILYPFVEDRINQFKEGVDWNYISLFFGWNDRVHGVQYYREKWLKDTYGTAIKYTTESSKYGTSGYCTESQRIACDNATEIIDGVSYTGYDLFFMKFIGNINDTTKYTYYGAYNYAVDYLMRKFPKAKIMLITPYIGDVNRMYYQKMRQAIIDVAEKFGIIYFDFGSLPYWYFTNMIQTPFANPDRADGKWYKDSWTPEEPELRLCNPTIEGFHQHLYCYDSVHPTNLGYEMISEPIGNTLMNG